MLGITGLGVLLANGIALIPGGGTAAGAATSALGFLVRCGSCLKFLGVAALVGWTAWHVHSADVAACDARIADDHARAEVARKQRDASIADELRETYQPKIVTLARERDALQQKVRNYAKRKPAQPAPIAGACKLGAAAGVLPPPESR